MPFGRDLRDGLNVALNEADVLDIAVDEEIRRVRVRLAVLSMTEAREFPDDRRVTLVLEGVDRLAVRLREELAQLRAADPSG